MSYERDRFKPFVVSLWTIRRRHFNLIWKSRYHYDYFPGEIAERQAYHILQLKPSDV